MGITNELEKLRDFPLSASKEFQEQLEKAKASAEKCIGQLPERPELRGIDRSRELTPIARPTIVRSLAREQ
jgi:hypothetical protein